MSRQSTQYQLALSATEEQREHKRDIARTPGARGITVSAMSSSRCAYGVYISPRKERRTSCRFALSLWRAASARDTLHRGGSFDDDNHEGRYVIVRGSHVDNNFPSSHGVVFGQGWYFHSALAEAVRLDLSSPSSTASQ